VHCSDVSFAMFKRMIELTSPHSLQEGMDAIPALLEVFHSRSVSERARV
jgi:hypothetical protein